VSPPGNEQRPAGKRSVIGSPTKETNRIISRRCHEVRKARCPLQCRPPCSACPILLVDSIREVLRELVAG
jgi:hypothetical protein